MAKEAHAAGVLCVAWVPGEFNLKDSVTKTTLPDNIWQILFASTFLNTA